MEKETFKVTLIAFSAVKEIASVFQGIFWDALKYANPVTLTDDGDLVFSAESIDTANKVVSILEFEYGGAKGEYVSPSEFIYTSHSGNVYNFKLKTGDGVFIEATIPKDSSVADEFIRIEKKEKEYYK